MGKQVYFYKEEQIKELESALKTPEYKQYYRRIQAVWLKSQGKTISEIQTLTGFSKKSVSDCIRKYALDGLEVLIRETRGGKGKRYLTIEEESAFLAEQEALAEAGQLITAITMFQDYQERIGRTSTIQGFYALLKRHNWSKKRPRPAHPKKADALQIEASKKLTVDTRL